MPIEGLSADRLYHACDPSQLDFQDTGELSDLEAVLGQDRAMEAIRFGVGMTHDGYNLYLAGAQGLDKTRALRSVLDPIARQAEVPPDWCYVNNFETPHRPRALRLPAGRGQQLRRDMEHLLEDLLNAIPAIFRSEEYRTRAQEISEDFQEREERAFRELGEEAKEKGVALLRTPLGYTLAPLRDGEPISQEDFDQLPPDEQRRIKRVIDEINARLKQIIRRIPAWKKESARRFKELNEEFTRETVEQLIAELLSTYAELPEVIAYLEAVRRDVSENINDFRAHEEEEPVKLHELLSSPQFRRYQVNVVIDNARSEGAPIEVEANPTYINLIGRIEHIAQMGTLQTDFTLIKGGALHRANGGYLILDVRHLLTHSFAYEALKRVLRAKQIRIESLERMLSLVSTISLEPEPIPLEVKVVLKGDRLLHYLLQTYDPEFGLLFKVLADFSEEIDRSPEATRLYARLIATLVRRERLRPFERDAVARVIEQGARQLEDGEKASLHMAGLTDLLREADYWAGQGASDGCRLEHVEQAIEARVRRLDQLRERLQEEILRDTILIDTQGTRIAQVNGLSVIQLGDFAFGRPSRITATVRLGEGKLIDIERETRLGGPIHSKGVLILSSYLGHRYASDRPLSLSASLVFEQSYGMVEGDSASAAELCALLSALAELPLRQSLAVTGSVNQLGQIQAIGAVNEKVEGFFDICKARGLDGEHGVLIPAANVKHLMLREELREAARQGLFHVYPVSSIDEVMALLTGLEPGQADAEGKYPAGTVSARIQARLDELNRLRVSFARAARSANDDDGD
jgi:lon-related putative ATP-dependent protease